MYKNIMAKESAKIDLVSLVVSNVAAIIMAYYKMSYWGIAIQGVLYSFLNNALRWYYSPWRPTIIKTFKPIGVFFGFSVKLLLTNIINQVSSNIFSVLLGKNYSVSEVGYYSQGNKWMSIGSSFTSNMVTGIAQPVISQITDDRQREIRVFHKMVRFISFVSFPVMFGFALIAKELIVITITDKWLPAVPILQLLCIWGAFLPMSDLYRHLAMSHGKSDFILYSYLLLGLTQLGVLILMLNYGIQIMVMVYVGLYFVWLLTWQMFAKIIVGISFLDVIKDIYPYALATAMALGLGWLFSRISDDIYFKLAFKVLVSSCSYFLIMKLSGSVMYNECVSFIKEKLMKYNFRRR